MPIWEGDPRPIEEPVRSLEPLQFDEELYPEDDGSNGLQGMLETLVALVQLFGLAVFFILSLIRVIVRKASRARKKNLARRSPRHR